MPYALKRPCRIPHCPNLTDDGACPEHPRPAPVSEQNRPNANQRGYTWRWHRYRTRYLRREPLCRACLAQGRTTVATEVDHITPVRQGGEFWDPENHQPLCKSCHSRKTQAENGTPRTS